MRSQGRPHPFANPCQLYTCCVGSWDAQQIMWEGTLQNMGKMSQEGSTACTQSTWQTLAFSNKKHPLALRTLPPPALFPHTLHDTATAAVACPNSQYSSIVKTLPVPAAAAAHHNHTALIHCNSLPQQPLPFPTPRTAA